MGEHHPSQRSKVFEPRYRNSTLSASSSSRPNIRRRTQSTPSPLDTLSRGNTKAHHVDSPSSIPYSYPRFQNHSVLGKSLEIATALRDVGYLPSAVKLVARYRISRRNELLRYMKAEAARLKWELGMHKVPFLESKPGKRYFPGGEPRKRGSSHPSPADLMEFMEKTMVHYGRPRRESLEEVIADLPQSWGDEASELEDHLVAFGRRHHLDIQQNPKVRRICPNLSKAVSSDGSELRNSWSMDTHNISGKNDATSVLEGTIRRSQSVHGQREPSAICGRKELEHRVKRDKNKKSFGNIQTSSGTDLHSRINAEHPMATKINDDHGNRPACDIEPTRISGDLTSSPARASFDNDNIPWSHDSLFYTTPKRFKSEDQSGKDHNLKDTSPERSQTDPGMSVRNKFVQDRVGLACGQASDFVEAFLKEGRCVDHLPGRRKRLPSLPHLRRSISIDTSRVVE